MIFCNVCLKFCTINQTKFGITSCNHVLCQNCIRGVVQTKKCILCKSQCKLMELGNKMPQGMKSLFEPPSTILQQYLRARSFNARQNQILFYQLINRRAQNKLLQEQVNEYLQRMEKHVQQIDVRQEQADNEIRQIERELEMDFLDATSSSSGYGSSPSLMD